MKKWLAEYWIGSEISTATAGARLRYVHPEGKYTILIRNGRGEYKEECELVGQIIVTAQSIAEASEIADAEMRKFVHLMAFVCNVRFRLLRRIGIIEADKTAFMREAHIDAHGGPFPTQPSLVKEILDTTAFFQGCGKSPILERALRWFANGVASQYMEDQFLFFWLTIEIIASSQATSEKVADKCQQCQGDLYCKSCGQESTHRPFPRQRIKALILSIRNDDERVELLFEVRNRLMHGKPREEIEAQLASKIPSFSFENAVNYVGKLAWHAILRQFRIPEGSHRPAFLTANTFVHKQLRAIAHMQIGIQFDWEEMSADCRPFAAVTVGIVHGTDDTST